MKMVLLVFATLLLVISSQQFLVHGDPIVPCYFIFGDSLADNGNNNPLDTKAKVNYPPYGIDFPGGVATGRFSNGKTYVDLIAEKVGFKDFILPFATAKGNGILRGVNYASGAAGIRKDTGNNQGVHVEMDQQLANHNTTIASISHILGDPKKTSELLNKCLYTVGIGSNDYINNYFIPGSPLPAKQNHQQYAQSLVDLLHHQLEGLHGLGARKVAIFGLGPIGCTPFEKASTIGGKDCSQKINNAVEAFNSLLKPLTDQLNEQFPDSKFTLISVSKIAFDPLITKGLSVLSAPCCHIDNTTGLCIKNSEPCSDRSLHAFWDGFHPTEAVNRITATSAWLDVNHETAYPVNIARLLQSSISTVMTSVDYLS